MCACRSKFTCRRCNACFDFKAELTQDDFKLLMQHVRECAKRFLNPEDLDEYFFIAEFIATAEIPRLGEGGDTRVDTRNAP